MAGLLLLALVMAPPQGAMWTSGTPLVPGIMEIERTHDPAFRPSGRLHPLTDGPHVVGETLNFWSIDYSSSEFGTFYLTPATCRFVGEETYIFVEDAVWGVHYDQDAVDALAEALEDSTPSGDMGIVGRDSDVFGEPPDEIDGDPRVYFLVLDIRDGFDPAEGGAYIAGFFSPYNQFTEDEAYLFYGGHSNEVEMLYLDCFPSDSYDAAYTASHEMVHLIQWGVEPFSGEELWVIENQAQSGTYVCGYPAFQVQTFLEAGGVTPIKWTEFDFGSVEYVAGYGAGFLFFSYIAEHYGGDDFLYRSLRTSDRGIAGVAEAIRGATGSEPDISSLLLDWQLACWVDDPDLADGRYGFGRFRIADYDTVSPGNRPGLDWVGIVDGVPWAGGAERLGSYSGACYRLDDGLTGSFRAQADGLGELSAWFVEEGGGVPEMLGTGSSGDVALDLSEPGSVLLLCSSFAGLDLSTAAGCVSGSGEPPAVYPQPCRGSLYLQLTSGGGGATLSVFDLSGAHIETVSLGSVPEGEATLEYEGASDLASGVYLYRLILGGREETGSFTVVR